MQEHNIEIHQKPKITFAQKGLLLLLYFLIVLMLLFSINARNNLGQEGFQGCIDWKCEKGGEEYCTKFREVNNCCLGAGGQTAYIDNKPSCSFT